MSPTGNSAAAAARPARRRAIAAWCLFDWANSAWPTVVGTFVFAAYFTRAVAPDPATGTAQWGWAMAASGLAVAVLSPPLGAVADSAGRRKPWLAATTALCIAATAMLWFATPGAGSVLWVLVFVALGNVAFEVGMVFYNAMLPDIAPEERIGRVSGWGWGLGYAGGLACLAVALFGLVRASPPPFGLDAAAAEPVRATALLVAGWFALFAVPLFLFVPDRPASGLGGAAALRAGLATLLRTLRRLGAYGSVGRFLLARMIYTDGLNTLFIFGAIYAAGTFGFTIEEVILFGMATNVTAGLGAVLFAWVDDRIGAKRTVVIALVGLIAVGGALLLIHSKTAFWALGLGLSVFFGPAQAASRSLMARLAPEGLTTEMFGLYALSGKATAFVGPALLGWVTSVFDSQRAGMATVLVFLGAGLLLLLPVRERGGA